jgi:hypothetical protein
VTGILGTENMITSRQSGLKKISLMPGQKNVVNIPLIDSEEFNVPPLHITIGRIKYFVKAMDKK